MQITPGIYRHYKHTQKSPRLYQVLGVARDGSKDVGKKDDLYVVYIPLYIGEGHTGPRWQVRSISQFIDKVEYNGQKLSRFTYIGQEL